MSVDVKVCGICHVEDALVAVDSGCWALGFVFYDKSPRAIDCESAAAIVREIPSHVLTVGVFVDEPRSVVEECVRRAGLGAAQLHGSESVEYATTLKVPAVIKAFRVGPGFEPSEVVSYAPHRILLDAYHPKTPGGTGEVFDWDVARRVGDHTPAILAGGLTPDNVIEAIEVARPAAVDVSSGVEQSPGRKDHAKIRAFMRAVSAATL